MMNYRCIYTNKKKKKRQAHIIKYLKNILCVNVFKKLCCKNDTNRVYYHTISFESFRSNPLFMPVRILREFNIKFCVKLIKNLTKIF